MGAGEKRVTGKLRALLNPCCLLVVYIFFNKNMVYKIIKAENLAKFI